MKSFQRLCMINSFVDNLHFCPLIAVCFMTAWIIHRQNTFEISQIFDETIAGVNGRNNSVIFELKSRRNRDRYSYSWVIIGRARAKLNKPHGEECKYTHAPAVPTIHRSPCPPISGRDLHLHLHLLHNGVVFLSLSHFNWASGVRSALLVCTAKTK